MAGTSIDTLRREQLDEVVPELVALDRIIFKRLFDGYAARAWQEQDFRAGAPHKWELSCVARSDEQLANPPARSGSTGRPVIGMWIAARHNLTTVLAQRIAVHPERQGRGVGKALFEHARRQVEAAGGRNISLLVAAANRSAIAFFETLGFTNLTGDALVSLVADRPNTYVKNDRVFIDDVHHHAMRCMIA